MPWRAEVRVFAHPVRGTFIADMDSMLRAGRLVVAMVGLAVALASACTPAPYGGDDADGGTNPGQDGGADAGPAQSGLVCQWENLPTLPGSLGQNLYLDEVQMPLRDVRAIGDAAPGDSRTYVASLDLLWKHGEAPPSLSFPMAPPGLYSRFEFRVQSGAGEGYVLTGEIVLPGHDHRIKFAIHDSQLLSVSIPLIGLSLEPGQVKTIAVKVDIAAVLHAIDWSQVEIEDDRIEIGEDSDQISIIRATLATSISATVIP
jgi:hypothetical protein